jgi:Xaa-Pro dipeptidase
MSIYNHYSQHMAVWRNRFDAALQQCSYDCLLIYSGSPIRLFLDDQTYPFRANPQFRAVVPINQPYCWLLYQPEQKPILLYYQAQDFWHFNPPLAESKWVDSFDIIVIKRSRDALQYFPRASHISILGDIPDSIHGQVKADINPASFVAQLNWNRAYKTCYEQACLREATDTAVDGHIAAKVAFYNGSSEFEINRIYLQACQQGESRMPYGNIVALNEHASVLHYTELSSLAPINKNKSLLIDAGADCQGYGADITRSYAFSEGLYGDLVRAMEELQLTLIACITPGLDFVDLHMTAHRYIAQLLIDTGMINTNAEHAIETGISAVFFPHGLGHLLGVQVHDVGGHQANINGDPKPPPDAHPMLRNTRTIEAGQILTIEPGLYFIESLLAELAELPEKALINWSVIDSLRAYGGIRIEDNVLIHNDRVENLTREAFATIGAR